MHRTFFRNMMALALAWLLMMGCMPALAQSSIIPVQVGAPFQLEVRLPENKSIQAGILKVAYEFMPLDGSQDFQLELMNLGFANGHNGAMIGNDMYMTSDTGVFEGHLCTFDFVLSSYRCSTNSVLVSYWVYNGDVEEASGMQILQVGGAQAGHQPPNRRVLQVGDRIEFGSYEQDDIFSNGTEPILWRVLVVQQDRALLISDQVLDQQVYHPKRTAVTWENCFLRGWLNNDFYRDAFTPEEQAQILKVTVPAHESPYYHDESSLKSIGNPTKDKIFLLSAREANEYFDSDWDRIAYATQYAIFRGVHAETTSEPCPWLMRQPHKHRTDTACVNDEGRTNDGVVNDHDKAGIRPAMWIKLP